MIYRNVCLLVFVFLTSLAFAETKKHSETPPAPQPQASTPTGRIPENLFGAMRWRQVGPFRGGRALAVTGVPGEPTVFYFGAASGGIWRSSDAGANWEPIFDKEDIASIGSIAVGPSDHNIIYAGSGEACIRGNITYGNGVYKSLDRRAAIQTTGGPISCGGGADNGAETDNGTLRKRLRLRLP